MELDVNNYRQIEGQLCVSTQELCDRLDIARKTLSEWEEKGCPKSLRGWWPLWEVLRWRGLIGSGVKSEEDIEKMSLTSQKLLWETNYKKLKTEEVEFANAVTKGEYIRKEDATAELQRVFVVLKRSVLGYSRKIANEVGPYVDPVTARRIERMITELSNDALGQLSIDGVYNAKKKKAQT